MHSIYIIFLPKTNFNEETNKTHDIAIIGGGMSGIAMAVNLQKRGFTNFHILEKYPDVGGTWYENRYPGCGCDIGSHFYSFSFSQNPNWSKRWSEREEIWNYIKKVVSDFKLKDKIKFNTEVKSCDWDENTKSWRITDQNGNVKNYSVVVNAAGALNVPKIPNFKGKEKFTKPNFHTARWDESISLKGKRVGIVGTGASTVQLVPRIADEVDDLYVFQRSAAWVPARGQGSYSDFQKNLFSKMPFLIKMLRFFWFVITEVNYVLIVVRSKISVYARRIIASEMKGRLGRDRELYGLIPDYAPACKRITPSDAYLETFLKSNVHLVTEKIVEITESGIQTPQIEHELDMIIWATGYDILQASKQFEMKTNKLDSKGNQIDLAEIYGESPEMYLGITHPNLPNAFRLLGPNTGLAHNSVLYMIECQVDYACECLVELMNSNKRSFCLKKGRLEGFMNMIQKETEGKSFAGGCVSWYRNEEGVNWTLWPSSVVSYWWCTLVCQKEDYKWE